MTLSSIMKCWEYCAVKAVAFCCFFVAFFGFFRVIMLNAIFFNFKSNPMVEGLCACWLPTIVASSIAIVRRNWFTHVAGFGMGFAAYWTAGSWMTISFFHQVDVKFVSAPEYLFEIAEYTGGIVCLVSLGILTASLALKKNRPTSSQVRACLISFLAGSASAVVITWIGTRINADWIAIATLPVLYAQLVTRSATVKT